MTKAGNAEIQVKLSCYSPNFIEQTAHCDHKPRAAWVFVRVLLHRRSAASWAECMIYSALVSFFLVPVFCWKAKGDVSLGFGAGVAGLGCVLPRGPGSGERAFAYQGSPPLLSSLSSGVGAGVRRCWRRGRVGAVVGWAVLECGGPSTTWAQMPRGCSQGVCTVPLAFALQRTHH